MGYMTTPLRGCKARRTYGEGFVLDKQDSSWALRGVASVKLTEMPC